MNKILAELLHEPALLLLCLIPFFLSTVMMAVVMMVVVVVVMLFLMILFIMVLVVMVFIMVLVVMVIWLHKTYMMLRLGAIIVKTAPAGLDLANNTA